MARKHGQSKTLEYGVWAAIKRRCYNPNVVHYDRYGGRGIRMCDAWRNSFEAFMRDMGPRPPGGTIDRIDNDGHYEPGNCRWVPQKQQVRNMSANRLITVRGETVSLAEWCERVGVSYSRTIQRLNAGRTPEEALFGPDKQKMLIHGRDPKELAAISGTDIATVYRRARDGWPLEEICSPPKSDARKAWATKRANRSASAT